jgi:Undecaprenyl-phosphate glucose phosphotransferase
MLKENRQLVELLFLVADLVVVTVAWIIGYFVRFELSFFPVEKGTPPLTDYLTILPLIWVIWGAVFRRLGLYKPMRGVHSLRETVLLFQANALSLLILMAAVYLLLEKTIEYSRLVFVTFGIIVVVSTSMQRMFLRFLLKEARRKGYNIRYMLVVGTGKVAEELIGKIRGHRELGIQLIGCLSRESGPTLGPLNTPIVGNYHELRSCIDRFHVDHLIIALPLEDTHFLPTLLDSIGDELIDVRIIPDLYKFITLTGEVTEFEGLPIVSIQTSPLEGIARLLKRGVDLIFSLLGLVILSPFLLLIALLIKLTSRGPILYFQERLSVDGSSFSIIKFRTMRCDAERHGPGWTQAADPRVTPLGKFLRCSSLDELPQLWNVLRGDMSIVGPRPERPVYIEEFRKRIPRYMLRHKVPAGMTGWAQIHGWRGDTSIDTRVEYDLYYIKNWSLLLDIKIVFLTFLRGWGGKNAY